MLLGLKEQVFSLKWLSTEDMVSDGYFLPAAAREQKFKGPVYLLEFLVPVRSVCIRLSERALSMVHWEHTTRMWHTHNISWAW